MAHKNSPVRLLRACRALERGILRFGALVAWLTLVPLIAVSAYDIVGRQFFNTGSTRLQELEWHFFLVLVMLCLGWAYLHDAHVRIDIVRQRLSARVRAWIELFGYVFILLPFCVLLITYGGDVALRAFTTGERSRAAMGLPMRWIIMSAVPIGGLLLLLAGLTIAIRNWLLLTGRRSAADPVAAPGVD